ncbi:hypothetical protein [Paramicrobacterium agarici]|uniref:Uncharacterized protein n=1 Tax=Paramicrobacterium agarici TaxID=630514 RepID=A0A2A9DYW6_9MICO|nr:hypothetical protein [Microbacterium agarici]PFG31172.1 hypothetical protein ATJ78_2127 [Microbacterium agarici]
MTKSPLNPLAIIGVVLAAIAYAVSFIPGFGFFIMWVLWVGAMKRRRFDAAFF